MSFNEPDGKRKHVVTVIPTRVPSRQIFRPGKNKIIAISIQRHIT